MIMIMIMMMVTTTMMMITIIQLIQGTGILSAPRKFLWATEWSPSWWLLTTTQCGPPAPPPFIYSGCKPTPLTLKLSKSTWRLLWWWWRWWRSMAMIMIWHCFFMPVLKSIHRQSNKHSRYIIFKWLRKLLMFDQWTLFHGVRVQHLITSNIHWTDLIYHNMDSLVICCWYAYISLFVGFPLTNKWRSLQRQWRNSGQECLACRHRVHGQGRRWPPRLVHRPIHRSSLPLGNVSTSPGHQHLLCRQPTPGRLEKEGRMERSMGGWVTIAVLQFDLLTSYYFVSYYFIY